MDGMFERMFREILGQPSAFILGLLMTVGLGVLVDMRLNRISEDFHRKRPEGVSSENWAALLAWPETYGGTVHWLGLMERCFYFTLFRMAMWPFLLGWLLFKLGCYWGIWCNIMRVRGAEVGAETIDTIVAQSRRGNALATLCLFATLGNLLVALLGALFAIFAMWSIGAVLR